MVWWDDPRAECPRCGELVDVSRGHDCDGELPFEGVCPMCGEQYDSYTHHLRDCEP